MQPEFIYYKPKQIKMDTKSILITAAIAAAVVLAMDFILPVKITAEGKGTRFATE